MRSTFLVLAAILAAPSAPAAAQTPPNAANARPTLALVNKSGQEIEELYVSATKASDWGEDRLGEKTVEKNGTFRLRLAEGCTYDMQVVYEDKRTEERMQVNLCRTPTQTFTAAEAHAAPSVPSHEFTLDNATSRAVTAVTLADTSDTPGEEDWGDNILLSPAAPGTQAKLQFSGECEMAVRVMFDNGSAEQRHSVSLCGDAPTLTIKPGWTTGESGPEAAVEPAGAVTVTNKSSHRLVELFVYPDGEPRGDERLGARVLDPGRDVQIALQRDGKCLFTLQSVFEGNVPDQLQSGIDFCPRRTVDVGAP